MQPANRKTRKADGDSDTGPGVMVMDAQTYRDLEVFESELPGAPSLYDLCNLTRNDDGARALRLRMERPRSHPGRIRDVQESVRAIMAHRPVFDRLPGNATTEVMKAYFHGRLPLLGDNVLEFGLGLLELRFGDVQRYKKIARGLDATFALVRALRRLVDELEPVSPEGDLGRILGEMRTLLDRPRLARIPDRGKSIWAVSAWRILRIDQTWRKFEHEAVDRLLELTFDLDALVSMADATRKHGFVIPQIEEGPLFVHGEDVVHPFIDNAAANPVALDQEHRMLFLTGPNMAGKTTYLRACALALYLAHLGMGVPARSFRFAPAQRLFSSIALTDNLRGGISFFRAEALRMKTIAQAVAEGYRVVAFMDEPFKGTNVKDALDASREILKRFAARQGSLFMFSSHLIELSEQMNAIDQVDCRHFEAHEDQGRLRFEYVLRPGVSRQRLGLRLLQEEGIFELLDGEGSHRYDNVRKR